MVSITAPAGAQVLQEDELRRALDACLEDAGHQPVEKVAKSIFPQALWSRANGDRHKLYNDYLTYLPDYIAMEPTKNCYGLYFARLIAFGINPKTGGMECHIPTEFLNTGGNQLEFIIQSCKPGVIRMSLQAAIFDPVRDQTANRRGFPCLQHVTFVPDFQQQTLALNAFYATQQLFVKAYGNWLGLWRLGAFVAEQTGLTFGQLNCYAGIQKMGTGMQPKGGKLREQLQELAKACIETTDCVPQRGKG
jgi:hypothetical protein